MILIVDDDADIRDSLQDFFEDQGFAVVTAKDGVDALDCLARGDPPSVVILDLLMPRLSGGQVYENMRADPRLENVPVIVSTSDPSRAPSGVEVIKKPIHLDRLLRAVRAYCTRP